MSTLHCSKHCQKYSAHKCTQFISTLGGRGNWTTDGCAFIEIDGNVVTCRCNHLTNFGVLVVCKIQLVISD